MSTTDALLRLLPALLIVLGALWVAKRFGQRATSRTAGLRVLARTPLTRGAHLATVDVGGQVLVLGVTDRQVSVVAELDHAGGSEAAEPTTSFPPSAATAMEPAAAPPRPWTGLIDRLRWMTSRQSPTPSGVVDRHAALHAQVAAVLPPSSAPVTAGARAARSTDVVEQLRRVAGSDGTRLVPRGSP